MARRDVTGALRAMLREQLCCIGRVAARHQLPDDAVWDVAKGFEVIYRRACREVKQSTEGREGGSSAPRAEPHPGLTYLLSRLDIEDENAAGAGDGALAEVGAKPSHV